MQINIAYTAWMRFKERLEYLKWSVDKFRKNLRHGHHELVWVMSCERDRNVCLPELEKYCAAEGIQLYLKPDIPLLATNLNYLYGKVCTCPYIFYLQEDFNLDRELDITIDIDFMEAHPEFDIIRYNVPFHENTVYTGDTFPGTSLREISKKSLYFHSDNPHIQRRTCFFKLGPYNKILAEDGTDHSLGEHEMNDRSKRSAVRILSHLPGNYFGHGGLKSCLEEKWIALGQGPPT